MKLSYWLQNWLPGVVLAGLIRLMLKKVTLPTFILEPRSFLEKCSDFMLHGKIMEKLIVEQDPVERFMIVCRWYLAGWHFKPPVCACVCMCVSICSYCNRGLTVFDMSVVKSLFA